MNTIFKIIIIATFTCFYGTAFAQRVCEHHEATSLSPSKFDAKGIARTETVRHDFDGNRQAIQVRVDFAPGASFPKHSHPGVEIAYVLIGTIKYEMDNKIITLQAGESIHIPAGIVHSAKNTGTGITSELATYIVDKDKPIVILNKSK